LNQSKNQAMAHCNTVFAQILRLVPRHEFEHLAKQHHSGRSFRTTSRWSQFVAMTMAQLAGRHSLRDIVENLYAQTHRLYHLGGSTLSRTSLSRINEDKPFTLYQALFEKLLGRCLNQPTGHKFRFKHPLYALDSTTIDLCLSMFPWADFRTTKGAVKLHVGLNQAGYLPEFNCITDGKTTDIEVARSLQFNKGSMVAVDRAYTDYSWYNTLNDNGIYFVSRQKSNARYRVIERHSVNKKQGFTSDQRIELTGFYAQQSYPKALRRVGYRDPQTGKHYVFITNQMRFSAKTIADIYKSRWQIELFFKCIKQNLKIKSFVGTSKNAVLTQIWIALCVYLMMAYLKFACGITKSVQQIIRLLQMNLFDKRELIPLLRGDPVSPISMDDRQISLFKS
jgi:putative transposase